MIFGHNFWKDVLLIMVNASELLFAWSFQGYPHLPIISLPAHICMPNIVFGIFGVYDAPNMVKWGYPWKDHAKYHLAWFPHCRSNVKLQSGGLNWFMGLYYRLYNAENCFVPFLYKVVLLFKSWSGKLKKKIGAFLVNNLRYFIWYLFHLHLIFIWYFICSRERKLFWFLSNF